MKLIKDLLFFPPMSQKRMFEVISAQDPTTYIQISNLFLHRAEGAQMWVAKEVSDDLQASDLDPEDIGFAEVDWPSNRLEVYFEDPEIPTFLATRASNRDQYDALCRTLGLSLEVRSSDEARLGDPEPFISIQGMDNAQCVWSISSRASDIDLFSASPNGSSTIFRRDSLPLSGEEESILRSLSVLLFKVLLFASSEGCGYRATKEKPTKKQGGKPGFKNRPVTNRLIVEYLPRHIKERREAQCDESNRHHQFKGRRGHWRRFKSEKFVNLQGKKKFIYPIPGPDGTVPRRKFVVRKP
jgi:hypothetical protein